MHIPVYAPKETLTASSSVVQPSTTPSVPNKRPVTMTSFTAGSSAFTNSVTTASEPPRKLQRTGPTKRPVAVPTATHTSVSRGVDCSVVSVEPNPQLSDRCSTDKSIRCPVAGCHPRPSSMSTDEYDDDFFQPLDSQTMLQQLFQHYCILYEDVLKSNPSVASEHALRHEEEVYHKSNKFTYRNVCIPGAAHFLGGAP